VTDPLPIDADSVCARAVLDRVPFLFHTSAFHRAPRLYMPGVAPDRRYRIPALPACFDGPCMLDVWTFGGFSALLAEAGYAAGGGDRRE
jgi:hypothetical protein